MLTVSLALLAGAAVCFAQLDCPKQCELSKCQPFESSDCAYGTVRDHCDCCPVCAQGEGEICDLDDEKNVRGFSGTCGDNLRCIQRKDIPDEIKEGSCVCVIDGPVCGSDHMTYKSFCQMRAAPLNGTPVELKHKGQCLSGPTIGNKISNVEVMEQENVVLLCEASGNPPPAIWWKFTGVENITQSMPGDDESISVGTRGGSRPYTVTSWLRIQLVGERHEGDYSCYTENSQGAVHKTSRVKVIRFGEIDN